MSWSSGCLNTARRVFSPNFSERPAGVEVSLIVLHNISLPPRCYGTGMVEKFFQNRLPVAEHPYFAGIADMRVSSHFFIERTGAPVQFVSCDKMAHHAGVSSFRGRSRCNEFSVGIEIEGCDDEPFTEAQYRTLLPLLRALMRQYPIRAICGHCDIAPARKTDPGPFFDWERLEKAGLPIDRTQDFS